MQPEGSRSQVLSPKGFEILGAHKDHGTIGDALVEASKPGVLDGAVKESRNAFISQTIGQLIGAASRGLLGG
jgi:hypothetical protein